MIGREERLEVDVKVKEISEKGEMICGHLSSRGSRL
jgi:hypothetical protein